MAPILCDTPEPLIRRADNASAKGALGSRGRQVTSPQYIYIPSAAESCPKNLAPRWMRAWKVRPSLGSLEKKKIYQQGVHGIFQTKAINFPPCKDGGGAHTLTHPLHVSLCAADHQVFSLQGVRNGEMLAYKLQLQVQVQFAFEFEFWRFATRDDCTATRHTPPASALRGQQESHFTTDVLEYNCTGGSSKTGGVLVGAV